MLAPSPRLAIARRGRRWLGVADGFPVFACVVEPAWADALWVAATAAAAVVAARLPSAAVKSPPCFASEAAPGLALALRPCSEDDSVGSPLSRWVDFSALRASYSPLCSSCSCKRTSITCRLLYPEALFLAPITTRLEANASSA